MNILNELLVFILAIMIMSGAITLIVKDPTVAKKVVTWELKQLLKIGRWVMKQCLQLIADICTWVHKKL